MYLFRERLEYLTGMVFGLYLLEDLFDLALLIDQKGSSMNTHVRAAHKLLLSPNTVSLHDLSIRVG
jgi:hypothetical protein